MFDLANLVPLLLLVALHALITLAYAALANSRQSYLRDETEHSSAVPPRMHITYQLSLLLVRFTIAAVTVTAFGQALAAQIALDTPDAARALAYTLVLLPTAVITLIVGDLVPEAIASSRADALAPWAIYPMRLLIWLLTPVVSLMILVSRWLAGIFGSSDKVNVVTEEELMTMLDASEKEGGIENAEKEMIYSVLEFGDKLVREVMVPRIDIIALEIDTTLSAARSVFVESGHSRIPVYEDNIDNIKGLLYAKDLLRLDGSQADKPIRDLMRKPFFVPESKRADVLLKELRANKVHMALVVDEYGGIAGLVTIEDLIEEIIGDIQDEYDIHEEAEYTQLGPDLYLIDAGMNLSDVNDLLEVELPTEDSDTLGGFLFTEFGHVPDVGETLEYGELTFRIESLDGRRIRKVRVTRAVAAPPDAAQPSSSPANPAPPQPQPVTE